MCVPMMPVYMHRHTNTHTYASVDHANKEASSPEAYLPGRLSFLSIPGDFPCSPAPHLSILPLSPRLGQ